jgi:hypothetical protein
VYDVEPEQERDLQARLFHRDSLRFAGRLCTPNVQQCPDPALRNQPRLLGGDRRAGKGIVPQWRAQDELTYFLFDCHGPDEGIDHLLPPGITRKKTPAGEEGKCENKN